MFPGNRSVCSQGRGADWRWSPQVVTEQSQEQRCPRCRKITTVYRKDAQLLKRSSPPQRLPLMTVSTHSKKSPPPPPAHTALPVTGNVEKDVQSGNGAPGDARASRNACVCHPQRLSFGMRQGVRWVQHQNSYSRCSGAAFHRLCSRLDQCRPT